MRKLPEIWISVLATLISLLMIAPLAGAAVQAGDGKNAYKLANHKLTVTYLSNVAMWDCWDAAASPRFYARKADRWVLWAVGEVSKDKVKCPGKAINKIVYRYTVSLKGKPVAGKPYNLLRVKEDCAGCDPSPWKLPVVVP